MSEKSVLITMTDIAESGVKLLSSNFKTTVIKENTRNEVLSKVAGVSAVLWGPHVRLDKEILDVAGPQLEMVGSISAGLDHIDVEELTRRGIKLSNTSQALESAVADMAVLLTLSAARRLQEGRLHIEKGTWKREFGWMLGQDLHGSTVGIVGLGNIGQAIVKRLKVFEVAKFVYSGHKEKAEGKALGAVFLPFAELLKESDFIIVACPLTPETKEMFNENAFNKMKNSAVFVNIARGGIVDQAALIKALKNGVIFAAGLDVMIPEPLPVDHEFLTLPNCVLVPHLGSATLKARTNMAELAAQNIVNALKGEKLLTPVY